jgi:hypothetical protein
MGIIHTAKKHIADELVKKKRLRQLEMLRSRNMNITSLSTRDEINVSCFRYILCLAYFLCIDCFFVGMVVHLPAGVPGSIFGSCLSCIH